MGHGYITAAYRNKGVVSLIAVYLLRKKFKMLLDEYKLILWIASARVIMPAGMMTFSHLKRSPV